eukprot:TRINITY_DN16556_c0_g1_i10.p1 TRINITY_DN16556_c0_g1~~TRINITY_DN16556_c0_g1_i10.p1  ORF type:complete len:1036 (+),score=233.71 TRINITY_DN16556_c0_g1_i10:67-3174(+)
MTHENLNEQMAASLVTEFQPFTGELSASCNAATVSAGGDNGASSLIYDELDDDTGLDTILDQEFPGLGVDFDFCNSLELGGVDLPLDIWNTDVATTNNNLASNNVINTGDVITSEDFDLGQSKSDENFNLDDEFNQMLNDWSQIGEQLKASDVEDILSPGSGSCSNNSSNDSDPSSTLISSNSFAVNDASSLPSVSSTAESELINSVIEATTSPVCSTTSSVVNVEPSVDRSSSKEIQQPTHQPVSPQTVTLKRPANFGLGPSRTAAGGNTILSHARQLPLSTTLRTPVVTRGFCYTTRTGGLGMSRAVQSNGIITSSSKVNISTNQLSVSTARQEESNGAPLFFTPLSPIRSPATASGSNAPDFFVASTRPTAEVVRSTSNYNKIFSNGTRNSIIAAATSENYSSTPSSRFSSNSHYQSRSSSPVKIIAAVSPRSDGTSCTKIFSSNSSIRDSLPKELIDKIRAASQGRKTIAIIEPINRKDPAQVGNEMIQRQKQQHQQARYQAAAAAVATSTSPISTTQLSAAGGVTWKNSSNSMMQSLVNNVSDHDYCSPTGFSRFSRKYLNAQSKVMRQMEEMKNKLNQSTTTTGGGNANVVINRVSSTSPPTVHVQTDEGETKKDSGLESCEMSDCSEDGSGTYDRLPRYLTNASVQTDSRPPTATTVNDEHSSSGGYNRLPAYLFKPQQSLLKSNLSKSVVEKHNIVVSPVNSCNNDVKVEEKHHQPAISLAAETPSSVLNTAVQVDSRITTDIRVDDENNVISRVSSTGATTTENSTTTSIRRDKSTPPTSNSSSLKRRRGSIDSSSDETDSSYRRSVKRKRTLYSRDGRIRTSSRERRRRYRGRSRSRSSSTERSSSRSDWSNSRDKERSSRRYNRYHHLLHSSDKKSFQQLQQLQQQQQQQQQQLSDQKCLSEERRIVYVGKIEEGTLKSDLRSRFETFGPILDISLHFRERGENYGFLTFEHMEDAKRAIEHGNDRPKEAGGNTNYPRYELCFGGRRNFCREDYCDLDDVEDAPSGGHVGFDELLRKAIETKRR